MPALREFYPFDVNPGKLAGVDILDCLALRRQTRKALVHTSGPVLEVGGPSPDGYIATHDITFPNGLIISDIEQWDEDVDRIIDVRDIPFPAKSLGGLMMQGLSLIPEEVTKAAEARGDHLKLFPPHLMKQQAYMCELVWPMEEEGDSSILADDDLINYSLRAAFLRSARQKVEPGGVIIADTLTGGDIRLAKQLGFEIQAAIYEPEYAMDAVNGELLMTLTELETPAGLFAESLDRS